MSNQPHRPIFRIAHVTPIQGRGRNHARIVKQGGTVFALDLPTTHEVDEWAARQSPPLSRTVAIAALIRRGMAN